jgi:nucleoside-diphosphate-sugar epimerase
MSVLVIGGSGFIGTYLVDELLKSGHTVRIFDKKPSARFNDLVALGDVRDHAALNAALKGIDAVYNLAAEHRDDVTPVSLYYDVNVQGAKNIVEAANINGLKKIIFTSTVAVYGLDQSSPDEASSTLPFNHYGKSKLQAELIFNAWAEKGGGNSLTVVRPVVIFGEGNRGNVFNLIKQIQSNKFMMVGLGENRKSMAYVGNVTKFLIHTLQFGPGKSVFNFADKPDLKVSELIELIQDELSLSRKILELPYSAGLAGGLVFDLMARLTGKKYSISSIRIRKFCANTIVSTRALEEIGFKSSYTLKEGLKRMIANIDHNIYFEGGG